MELAFGSAVIRLASTGMGGVYSYSSCGEQVILGIEEAIIPWLIVKPASLQQRPAASLLVA